MQPSSLGHHFAISVGKRDVPNVPAPLPSAAFLSALSHPEGQHKHHLPSTGKGINSGESEKYVLRRKPWTLKFSPFPPSFGEPHSVHMPYRSMWDLSLRQGVRRVKKNYLYSMYWVQGDSRTSKLTQLKRFRVDLK